MIRRAGDAFGAVNVEQRWQMQNVQTWRPVGGGGLWRRVWPTTGFEADGQSQSAAKV
jgi:hypothetical protein